jgi:ribosome-associated protein
VRPAHVEGYKQGEWILVDYLDFVVHVFSEKARKFYDLERLWKTAKRLEPSDLAPTTRTKTKGKSKAKLAPISKNKKAASKQSPAALRRRKA